MSHLSYMEKLLDGVEVEWKVLEEVFDILAGGDVPKDSLSNIKTEQFNIPILSNGIGERSLYGWTDKAKVIKPSITVSARGTIGWTSFQDKPFFPIVRLIVLTPKIELNVKYVYYYMKSIENAYNVPKNGIPQLTKPMIRDIKIPLPPLNVQAETVRILDAFTELTAELTAELVARKQQYGYYRDQLLTFEEDDIEWKDLGELATLRRGRVMSKGYLVDNIGNYPVYSSQTANNGEIGKINTFDFEGEYVNWTTDGANAGTVFYRTGKFSTTYVSGLIKINDTLRLNYKYLFYWLSIEAKKHVNSGMGNPKLMSNQVEKIPVPIPSLSKQKNIVAILDKFEALTTSLTEGLPREIALRQKQYEYYRELLLSFPKPKVANHD